MIDRTDTHERWNTGYASEWRDPETGMLPTQDEIIEGLAFQASTTGWEVSEAQLEYDAGVISEWLQEHI